MKLPRFAPVARTTSLEAGRRPRTRKVKTALGLVVALLAPVLALAGARLPAPALAAAPQVGDIAGVTLNPVGFTNLASFGLDGLIKARGQNGDVAILGNTAFVGGGSLFHGAQASGGRICTDYGGVKVVDITNPASPTLRPPINIVDIAGSVQGPTTSPRFGQKFDNVSASAGAVDAITVPAGLNVSVGGSPFTGDVLAIAIQRCEQSFFAGGRLEFWNVSNPLAPVKISAFDPAVAPWGIYEDVRMFTRVVSGVPKLFALTTTPFSIGNSHDAVGTGDMRIIDLTNLSAPTQVGTFPAVAIGESSINGCKTFLAGRAAAPSPDGNRAILSFYDGANSPTLTPNAPGQRPTVFDIDLNNVPATPNGSTPFSPQPKHFDYPSDPNIEINAADVAPFTATNTGPTNGNLLTVVSEDDIDPARTTFTIGSPASAAYTSGPGAACETFIGTDLHTLPGQTTGTLDIVDVGRGCPASTLSGTLQRAEDPYLANPSGKIAYVDGGGSTFDGCSAVQKAKRAAAAGAVALLTNGVATAPGINGTNNGPPGDIPPIPSISIEGPAASKIQLMPTTNLAGTAFPSTFTRSTFLGLPGLPSQPFVMTATTSAAAVIGATTLNVNPIPTAIPSGTAVMFGTTVAQLTAPAAQGATTLSVVATTAAIGLGVVGTVSVATTSAAASTGSTTMTVFPVPVAIPSGTALMFGTTVAQLTAPAAPGATSLSVAALAAAVAIRTSATVPVATTIATPVTGVPPTVTTSANGAVGATTLSVNAMTVALPSGAVIVFGTNAVQLTAPASVSDTSLSVVALTTAVASGATGTVPPARTAAAAVVGATSLTVKAIPFALPSGTSLFFGSTAVQLTAPANIGDTTLAVAPLPAAVGNNVSATGAVANAGTTSLPVYPIPNALPTGTALLFGTTLVQLTAPAAAGDTSLTVAPLPAIAAKVNGTLFSATTTAAAQPGDTTLNVGALPAALDAGTALVFGTTVVHLTAPAAAGATTLTVAPIPAVIGTLAAPAVGATAASNATVQPLCIAQNVSASAPAAIGATTLAVRPTLTSLPAGTVLPFVPPGVTPVPPSNQVTVTVSAPAGSTSLTVAPLATAITLNSQAVGPCPDSTAPSLYRTDVSRFRSLASASDPVGKGELATASRVAVTAGETYRAGITLEVPTYTSGSFGASVVWYNATGGVISESPIASMSSVQPRTPFESLVTAPVGAARAGVKFEWTGGGSGVGYADSFQLVPNGLTGSATNTAGEPGPTQSQWGTQKIVNFSTPVPSLVGTYRSPNSLTWPPPDDGIYTPRITEMVGGDLAFTTWMTDGLRVLNLRDPANPVEVASFLPAGVPDPAPLSGSGNGDFRGQVWPNKRLLTGIDSKPTGPNSGVIAVSDINAGLHLLTYSVTRVAPAPVADFDGDGDTDISVFRPSTGVWYAKGTPNTSITWGQSGDIAVPADYNGDAVTDEAVFRPSDGVWYVNTPTPTSTPWGTTGDKPVPADYDGDGDADLAVFRPSTGIWYINGSPASSPAWGAPGDVPVPADYDGDGDADLAVFRPSTGVWYVNTPVPAAVNFGATNDIPVPADYDGDGDADLAVFRPSNGVWYVNTPTPTSTPWGASGDVPVVGDYDGDGDADLAVYRPSNNVWYVNIPTPVSQTWGAPGDIPLPIPTAVRTSYWP